MAKRLSDTKRGRTGNKELDALLDSLEGSEHSLFGPCLCDFPHGEQTHSSDKTGAVEFHVERFPWRFTIDTVGYWEDHQAADDWGRKEGMPIDRVYRVDGVASFEATRIGPPPRPGPDMVEWLVDRPGVVVVHRWLYDDDELCRVGPGWGHHTQRVSVHPSAKWLGLYLRFGVLGVHASQTKKAAVEWLRREEAAEHLARLAVIKKTAEPVELKRL